ncbi:MAG: peptidoglycan-binding protein [Archangium sp.]|nr:peptidoglycan-binding protein [Archangium sp.]MDP3575473.1 peptidoglycan-binding protein [Archangium sp.]
MPSNVSSTSAARRTSSRSSASGRLQEGASGAAVKELQQLLKSIGLYGKNADGEFGPVTTAAVKAFQRKYGLTADGWAGPQTMAKLRQVAAPRRAPAPAAPPVASSGGKLALGATGPEVKELQLRLKAQGFYDGNVGGNFGPGTEAAVKAFQRANRMTVDGWAGPQTMAKLRGTSAPTPTNPAAPVTPSTPASHDARVQAAIDFGMSNLGAPYVGGGSPFRFGTRPGDGRVYQMQGQKPYRSPAGVIGFDCSGFVVAMFRKAGVDLAAQNIASSATMKNGLPSVPKNALRPGDLLVKNGHVVIYLGGGKVLESTSLGDPDGDGLGNGTVRVNDASKFLNDSSYVGRRVPLP